MSGYVGDLSPSQTTALADMKKVVGEVDDHTLTRFLRAREFDVQAAVDLYKLVVKYRKESGIENILTAKLPKTDVFNQVIPHLYSGFDRDGRPIYFEKTGIIDFDTVFKYLNDEDLMRHHLYQMERQIERCKESSQLHNRHVDNVCNVVDLAGLNMSHRKALRFIRLCASHDQTYHPERLGRVLLVNAPWVFPWFWKVCSRWLNPRTQSKIIVLGKDFKNELTKYIDPQYIPVEYGGRGPNIPVHDISSLRDNGPSVDEDLEKPAAKEHNIPARDKHEEIIRVPAGGGLLEWAFKANKDVNFSVEIRHSDSFHAVEPTRLTAHKGSVQIDEVATCIVRFDNSHSIFTAKTVKYYVNLADLNADNHSQLGGGNSQLDLLAVTGGVGSPKETPEHSSAECKDRDIEDERKSQ